MESIEFFNIKKIKSKHKKKRKIKNQKKAKFLKCFNYIRLKLIIFCALLILILYLIYLFISIYNNNSHGFAFIKSYKSSEENKVNSFIQESLKMQIDFCNNPDKYLNQEYENMINLTDFGFKNISYQFYVYKEGDNYISNSIKRIKGYDFKEMGNFYEVLEHYRETKNILNKKDIYMLDIGGNLGVYPTYFGKLGYTVISMEASPRNYYISKKNYCRVNRDAENIIIINRGVSNQEKICNYYTQITGIGNGMLKCDDNRETFRNDGFLWKKIFEVPIVKLSSFIPYLVKKNLALIKLDIEGSESLVMRDAIEFVTKYHIPYIFSEYSKNMIREHGDNPKEFIKLFTDNSYKVSKEGFLSENFIEPDKVTPGNLYFTYYGN